MKNNSKEKTKFVCYDCFRLKKCKESAVSWIFFFIALIAVVALRAVNMALDFSPLWAKVFWYVGVAGFLMFFLYKFRYDNILHRELEKTNLSDKLLSKSKLSEHDYEVLGTVICKLKSRKDKLNYFFIFFFSVIALVLAVYSDFFKK